MVRRFFTFRVATVRGGFRAIIGEPGGRAVIRRIDAPTYALAQNLAKAWIRRNGGNA